ncbi:hypothetical protein B0H14DRAFT_2588522 [Mycena olivaceomarginata]|nr:hypothetical protein B0H14DRAFT_2588522 [Mycena olivaceomarginata]
MARAALRGGRVRERGHAAAERTQVRGNGRQRTTAPYSGCAQGTQSGFCAGGGAQRSGGRGTMRTAGAVVADGERMREMKGTCEGNRLGAQNAHGAKREGAQYAERGRGTRQQAWGSKRRYGNAGGRRRRHVRRRMAVYRTTGWALRPGGISRRSHGAAEAREPKGYQQAGNRIATARSIAAPATGFASCKFGHCQNEYQIFLRTNFRAPEGQQQLLWKGLLRLEVQQGSATVYSTYGNGLAEGEGFSNKPGAKGS